MKKVQHWLGVALIVAFLGHFAYFFFGEGTQLTFNLDKVGGATLWQLLVLGSFIVEAFLVRGKGSKLWSPVLLNSIEGVFLVMICAARFWKGATILKWLYSNGISRQNAGFTTIGVAVLIVLGNILWAVSEAHNKKE